jgi:Transposase DDE domain/Domain of unknown function (DUF4372)
MKITLFAQIIQKISRDSFKNLVSKHKSNKHCKGNDAWTHFVTMLFCHFSKSNSLNEVCNGIRSATGDLNHFGVAKALKKSSLAYINENRSWELFRDMYFELYDRLRPTMRLSRKLLPKRQIFLLDSTTIDLCLNVFDWAKFRTKKGAIKLHTVLDFDECMPVFVDLSDGKTHDITAAKQIEFPLGSVVVADRGYMDFSWLNELKKQGVFFVVRCRENVKMDLNQRKQSKSKTEGSNVEYDWEGHFSLYKSKRDYPEKIRMVQIWDEEEEIYIELLTNNFTWTASTIEELYKRRWNIESFFKEMKTHLKIKSFVGTSMNAVLIQIWTALITILLLKSLQRTAEYKWHLSNLVAFIRLNLFVKIDLQLWLDKPFLDDDEIEKLEIQLTLF